MLEELSGKIQQELETFSRNCTDEMDVAFHNQMQLEQNKQHIGVGFDNIRF